MNHRRNQHQEHSHLSVVPQHANGNLDVKGSALFLPEMPTARKAGPFSHLFAGNKDKSEVLVIDFVTPHGCIECETDGCTYAAIPLTGLCEAHDPLCLLMTEAVAAKNAPKPQAQTQPATVENPDAIYSAFDNDADLYAAGYGAQAREHMH